MYENVYLLLNTCERRVVEYDRLQLFLEKNGVTLCQTPEKADCVIFFACGMKPDHTLQLVADFARTQKKIVLYGCAARMLKFDNIQQITLIGLDETEKLDALFGRRVRYAQIDLMQETSARETKPMTFAQALQGWDPRLLMPLCRDVYSVTISKGCSNACSYCAIHFATGKLRSRSIPQIVGEFKAALQLGYRYFRLQCENAGSYGQDIGTDLGQLLDALGQIPEMFSIDLPDLHPAGLVRNIDSILRFGEKKQIYLIHLPIQSASQNILNAMNRRYDMDAVCACMDRLRERLPNVPVGTDLIIGFPGETEADFCRSVEFVKRYRFDPVYIHGYCVKEGTPAADLPNTVSEEDKVARIARAYEMFPHAACYLNNYRGTD